MSVRYDFYQTDQKVVITVQIKNAAERNCVVDIGADRVTVKGDEDISLELALFDKINDAKSTYRITPIKIEISLKKIIGDRWPTLTKADGAPAAPAMLQFPWYQCQIHLPLVTKRFKQQWPQSNQRITKTGIKWSKRFVPRRTWIR